MAIVYRLIKNAELTYEEVDGNFRTLDHKDYKTTSDPTANDDSSKNFEVGSRWTNTTTNSVYICSDDTAAAAVWDLEVQSIDKVVMDTDPTNSDSYDFIGQRWINKSTSGADEVVNKIFIATAVTSGLFAWVQVYPTNASTGLEAINGIEANKGWRLIGRDPANYCPIGNQAVDFSYSDDPNGINGAKSNYDAVFGKNNLAEYNGYSLVGGLNNKAGGYSLMGGKNNSDHNGAGSIVGGDTNTVVGSGQSIVGGDNNNIDAESIVCGTHNTVGERSVVNGEHNNSNYMSYCNIVGSYLNATAQYQQWYGKYNAPNQHIVFGIGNGTDEDNRSNFIELHDNGTLVIGDGNTAANGSVAMGENTASSGSYSFVMGSNASSDGNYAFAMGSNTAADNYCSVAMGYGNTAVGSNSFAMGNGGSIDGLCSFGMGYGLVTGYNFQAVFGMYNDNKADTLFEIGNGADGNARSNLIELYSNGALHIDKLVDTTANRPTLTKASNIPYYDTDLDAPVWWNGTTWKEISGGGGGTPIMSVDEPHSGKTLTEDDYIGREWLVYDANNNNLLLKKYICFKIDTVNNLTYWTIKDIFTSDGVSAPSNLLIGKYTSQVNSYTVNGCIDNVHGIGHLYAQFSSLTLSKIDRYSETSSGGSLYVSSSIIASGNIKVKNDSNILGNADLTFSGCVIGNEENVVIHNDFSGLAVGGSNLLFNRYSMQMNINLASNGYGDNYNLGKNTSGKVSCASYTTGDGTPENDSNKIYFPKNSVTKMKGSCVAINEVSGEKLSASYDLVIDVTDAGVITIKSSTFTVDFQDVPAWSLYEVVTDNGNYPYLTVGINGEAGTDTVRANFSFDFTQVHDSDDPNYYYYASSSSSSSSSSTS